MKKKIAELKAKSDDILILADLFGGSPFNRALCESCEDKKIKVIAGVNLPMIIEAIMNKSSNLDDVVLKIVEYGKDSVTQGIVVNTNNLENE